MSGIDALNAGAARSDADRKLMRFATYAAVGVALGLAVLKAVAFAATGSVALLGSLFDSLLDGVASLINLVAVSHSLTPADEEHRFGHGKAEALAGLGQSVLIFGSAAYLLYESTGRLFEPAPVANGSWGIAVIVISIVATLALVRFQRNVAARTGSLAIAADSIHYKGDLFMNLAVIAALVLAGPLGIAWLDGAFGIAIALFIAWNAVEIVQGAYAQLMDRELDDERREEITTIVLSHQEVRGFHDLRTRVSGADVFIQFHLELDPAISLLRAHEIADEVEARVRQAFPGAEVMIHQDPEGLEEPSALERA